MSSPSRQRRVLANRLGREAVFKRGAAPYEPSFNPYTEDREARIFEKAYQQGCASYRYYEELNDDMARFHGYANMDAAMLAARKQTP